MHPPPEHRNIAGAPLPGSFPKDDAMKNRLAFFAACLMLRSIAGAQPVPGQPAAPADPMVKENATVKLAEHTYVIPDGNVGCVPNVGIIVGSRATLVIDPGLGRRNGETVLREVAKVSKNSELYIVSTHYPCRAHHRVPGVSRHGEVRQLDGAGGRIRGRRRGR